MKKNLKKLITPILSLILFASVGVGSTYALFSDDSETNIAITSGKVKLTATLNNLVLYTPQAIEMDTNSISNSTNIANGLNFGNGGSAAINGSVLSLSNMLPGDKAEFGIDFDNNSDISIKYRITYEDVTEYTGSETYKLIDELDIQVDSTSVTSPTTIKDWTSVEANADIDTIHVSVELPTTCDNNYQTLSAKVRFTVEALQGNAYTAPSTPTTYTWWDSDLTGEQYCDATTLNFTKTYVSSPDDISWSAPHNLTAYYNENNLTLTYLLSGSSIVLEDNESFSFGVYDKTHFLSDDEFEELYYAKFVEAVNEVLGTNFSTYAETDAYLLDAGVDSETEYLIDECLMNKLYFVYFPYATSINGLDLFDVSHLTSLDQMFAECEELESVSGIENWNTSNAKTMRGVFYKCEALEDLTCVSNWNTSKVENFESMFQQCHSLEDLNVSNFDTSKCKNFSSMFEGCYELENLSLSNFNTGEATNLASMFSDCKVIETLDLSYFDTSKVTNMSYLFCGCAALTTLKISTWNTANVTALDKTFYGCSSIETLDLSNFNTSNCTSMWALFANCSSLTSINLSSFDTSNVIDMIEMFRGCSSIQIIDLSSFSGEGLRTKITVSASSLRVSQIFSGCSSLTTVYSTSNFDFGDLNEGNITTNIAYGAVNLVGGNGTTYNVSRGIPYLHIDGVDGKPGYFTAH